MAAPRSGWEEKAPSYRSRLIGAGRSGKLTGTPMSEAEVRAYWEAGGDLRAGRSHVAGAQRPRYAAPRKATLREAEGMGDAGTYAELQRWRKRRPGRGGPPAWLPSSELQMGTDTAAILSQIDIPPSRWKTVDMVFLPDGRVVVNITSKRGAFRQVTLPDATAVEEFGRLLKNPVSMATTAAERRRLEKEWARRPGDGIQVSTSGYRKSPEGRAA